MNAEVRRAQAADGPGLYGAWVDLREHYGSVDHRFVLAPVSEEEFTAGLAEALARGTTATFVAVDDDRIVGFASGGIEANQPDRLPAYHAMVGYLYVEPPYRRTGLGRRLVDAVGRWAASYEGVSHLEMAVLSADHGAEPFWRALGFTPFIERLWAPLAADRPR